MPIPGQVPTGKAAAEAAFEAAKSFLELNGLTPLDGIDIREDRWTVSKCAYYRPSTIHICIPMCDRPATEGEVRNWNWPRSKVDKTPFGVVMHELGHHVDYWASSTASRGPYYGDHSEAVMNRCDEEGITGYASRDAPEEWFAEAFRLYMTNPDLLRLIRPLTYAELSANLMTAAGNAPWLERLGKGCPQRIIDSLQNAIHKARKRK